MKGYTSNSIVRKLKVNKLSRAMKATETVLWRTDFVLCASCHTVCHSALIWVKPRDLEKCSQLPSDRERGLEKKACLEYLTPSI